MGEGSVGKTTIRSRFMGVGFKSDYIKTIGADFASKAIEIGENKVHFQIWDLAGQKMYRHVRSSFYSGCKCGFLVFDLTQPETLEELNTWIDEALEHSGGFLKIFIILGNKHDLKDQLKVQEKDVKQLLNKLNKMKGINAAYLETSALTGENIDEAFHMMGKMFLEKEGFPREGHGSEIDDETLDQHHQEIKELITVPSAPFKDKESIGEEKIDLSEFETEVAQEIIKTMIDKIDHLTKITLALEERLLHVETKKTSEYTTRADIKEIREKIDSLENHLDKFSIATDGPIDESLFDGSVDTATIPVPTIADIGETKEKDTSFDVLDRTFLETMEVDDDNDEEVNITEILEETEKDVTLKDKETKLIEATEIVEEKEAKKKKSKKTKEKEQRCPKCGSKLSFIKQYTRWYCYRCKIYV